MDVERLIATEETRWRALCDAFAALTDERMQEPGITPDGWSAKDVMFHIGAWMADCGLQLQRMRAGTFEEPLEDVETQNREWFELSRTMDLTTVRSEFVAARTRMIQELDALDEVTSEAWEWFEESGPLHYDKHVEDLRVWASRAGG